MRNSIKLAVLVAMLFVVPAYAQVISLSANSTLVPDHRTTGYYASGGTLRLTIDQDGFPATKLVIVPSDPRILLSQSLLPSVELISAAGGRTALAVTPFPDRLEIIVPNGQWAYTPYLGTTIVVRGLVFDLWEYRDQSLAGRVIGVMVTATNEAITFTQQSADLARIALPQVRR